MYDAHVGVTVYYDGLGSTRALTDTTGTITDSYDYDAYGNLIDSSGSTDNSYRFTGEQYDASLGHYYLRARYYDPNTGTFPQMDTWLGLDTRPLSLNKYIYAEGDPVNNIDPSGNQVTLIQSLAAVTVIGVAATLTVQNSPAIVVTTSDPFDINFKLLGIQAILGLTTNAKAKEILCSKVVDLPVGGKTGSGSSDKGSAGPCSGDDGSSCQREQKVLLGRRLRLENLLDIMPLFQRREAILNFNKDVEEHNKRCPSYSVDKLPVPEFTPKIVK